MKPTAQDELDRLLEAVDGDLASLSAAERARFNALIDAVADAPACPDRVLAQALEASEQHAMPSPADWERVWRAVETAGAKRGTATRRMLTIPLRLSAAAGIAAALFFAVLFALPRQTADAVTPIRIASDVEIHELEVSDGTPFVISVGSNGAEVVWVLSADG